MVETLDCHLVLLFIGKKIQSDMNKTHPDLTYKCLHIRCKYSDCKYFIKRGSRLQKYINTGNILMFQKRVL